MAAAPSQVWNIILAFSEVCFRACHTTAISLVLVLLIINKGRQWIKLNSKCFEGKWSWCFHLFPWFSMFKDPVYFWLQNLQRSGPLDPICFHAWRRTGENSHKNSPSDYIKEWLLFRMTLKNGMETKNNSLSHNEMLQNCPFLNSLCPQLNADSPRQVGIPWSFPPCLSLPPIQGGRLNRIA